MSKLNNLKISIKFSEQRMLRGCPEDAQRYPEDAKKNVQRMTRGVQMMIRECSEAAQKGTCLRMLWGCQWELRICLEEAQRILKGWSDDSSGDSETAQRKPKDYPEDDHSRPKDYPEDAQIRPKDYEEDAERMTEVTQRKYGGCEEWMFWGCSPGPWSLW